MDYRLYERRLRITSLIKKCEKALNILEHPYSLYLDTADRCEAEIVLEQ